MTNTYRLKDGIVRVRRAGLKLDREDEAYPTTVEIPESQAEQHSDVLTLHKSGTSDEDDEEAS